MSRIVVKNLPTTFTEQKLRRLFDEKAGQVTDVLLKYTRQGKFRQFGFVGFKSDREASRVVEHFHGTFVGASKIKVEICANLGDVANKPRAWSKHAINTGNNLDTKTKPKVSDVEKSKTSKSENVTDKYEKDPMFAEFMEVHKSRSKKAVWSNDAIDGVLFDDPSAMTSEHSDSKNASDSEVDDEGDTKQSFSDDVRDIGIASDGKLSDLDYLKSKTVTKETGDTADDAVKENPKEKFGSFSITLRGTPLGASKSEIKKFLSPAKISRIRRPRKIRGIFHVDLASERDLKLALNKHRSFLDGHRISASKSKRKSGVVQTANVADENQIDKFMKFKTMTMELEKSTESIAESGMLFVRNLPFTVTEDEIEALFKPYGPLAEIRLPIDRFTRKVMGFAIVMYVIPEHATKAYCELDGTTFQGRNLHLLPGKAKNVDNVKSENHGSSFKSEAAAKKKSQSGSSHNWNALFLGANAVADVVASKYDTTKQDLLDAESPESIAVRLALGETQIVIETRKFLLDNGIELDSFSQPAGERSTLVILAKNLPAATSVDEIRQLFAKFGLLGRIVLPPSGVTAVIEFFDSNEARNAFRSLAYTKFKSTPLYLEWAPMKVFGNVAIGDPKASAVAAEASSDVKSSNSEENDNEKTAATTVVDDDGDSSAEDDEPEPETTIFVKNLSTETTDEAVQKHFEKCGRLHLIDISKKKDVHNPGNLVSLGYGFIRYKLRDNCLKAMRFLQNSRLDGQSLVLKLSDRATRLDDQNSRRKKSAGTTKQKSTKILIRNIPFEATKHELKKLFRTFGELKGVRLPLKMTGTGSHRGFGFVDFLTRPDAKRAFNALCHSTHFYGRRLVLEWADADESVEELRRKTAEHFHEGAPVHKRARKAAITDQVERMFVEDD